jgi:thiol-disulfide isomerase/thioredoxin
MPPRLAVALEEARKGNKLVLLDFTGSDWCALATNLEAEVLTKPEFLDYSAKYLVTLVVDFPMHRELPEELMRDNIALKKRFDVEGFPTLVALSPNGKVVWKQAGFIEGGPTAVIGPIDKNRVALGLPESGEATGGSVAGTSTKTALENLAAQSANAEPTPASQGLPENAPKLQALLFSRKKSSVILGGKQCNEGDVVDGMRVVKILEDRVMVEWEGRTAQLVMH